MDEFNELRSSVTDTFVTVLTKKSKSQEAMDNRLNQMSNSFQEGNNALLNHSKSFRKKKDTTAPEGLFFTETRPKPNVFNKRYPEKY